MSRNKVVTHDSKSDLSLVWKVAKLHVVVSQLDDRPADDASARPSALCMRLVHLLDRFVTEEKLISLANVNMPQEV